MDTFDDWFKKRHGDLPTDRESEEYADKLYLKHETQKAWGEANKRAAAIAIRMTEIPKDAKNPTRDRIVEVGEYISEAILK